MIKYDLTSAQKNIYELQSFYKGTSISVLCGAVIFEEKLEKEILLQAVRLLIQKHEALRLRFCTDNGKAMQYVDSAYCDEIDFVEFHSPDEMRKFCNKQAHIPFEMNGSQMFRIMVFELPESSGIMLCASHLIADAWTYSVLAKDVFDIYLMLCKGEKTDIEACSFTECIEKNTKYLSSKKYEADRVFWSEKYSRDISETPVRICKRVNDGTASERYTTFISSELSNAADEFCREKSISAAALFESAILIYLSKINRDNRAVTIGVPVLGRSCAKEKNTAGMFISTIPLTAEIGEN